MGSKMAAGGVMRLLAGAMVMALLVPMEEAKVVKRDLSRAMELGRVQAPTHIDILVSLNDEEPQRLSGDYFAAYRLGDKVTLTCITEGYPEELVDLSWWEGQRSLQFIRQYSQFARSSSTSLEAVSLDDSGRTFSCRADDSTHTRTVTLQVNFSGRGAEEEVDVSGLRVVVNHEVAMKDGGLLVFGAGDHLSLLCLMQGSAVKRVSWWEGEHELPPNTVSEREHASSSELVLRHLATADSGRHLSCRVDDSTLQRTVELLHNNQNKEHKSIIHVFGRSTVAPKEINTKTLIAIWVCIFLFAVVSLILGKLCKKSSPAPSSSSSNNQEQQPKRYPGKGCSYSPVGRTVTSQGMQNRALIFGRRFSAVPTAAMGDTAKTHGGKQASGEAYGGKQASGEAYTNAGFV